MNADLSHLVSDRKFLILFIDKNELTNIILKSFKHIGFIL
jgi:hypothetical protein